MSWECPVRHSCTERKLLQYFEIQHLDGSGFHPYQAGLFEFVQSTISSLPGHSSQSTNLILGDLDVQLRVRIELWVEECGQAVRHPGINIPQAQAFNQRRNEWLLSRSQRKVLRGTKATYCHESPRRHRARFSFEHGAFAKPRAARHASKLGGPTVRRYRVNVDQSIDNRQSVLSE